MHRALTRGVDSSKNPLITSPNKNDPGFPILNKLLSKLVHKPEAFLSRIDFTPGEVINPQMFNDEYLDYSTFVIQDGSILTSCDGKEYEFPPSYIIIDPRDALPEEENEHSLVAGPDGATILCIRREELRSVLRNNKELLDLVLEHIHSLFPEERTPATTTNSIRVARDESILSFASRESVQLVNGPNGLQTILNPSNTTIKHRDSIGGRDRLIAPGEQTLQLVGAIAPIIRHMNTDEIYEVAKSSRKIAESLSRANESGKTEVALSCFKAEILGETSHIFSELMPELTDALPKNGIKLDSDVFRVITDRVLQIQILQSELHGSNLDFAKLEQELLSKLSPDKDKIAIRKDILRVLDLKIEALFNTAHSREDLLDDSSVFSIKVTKYPLELRLEKNPGENMKENHRNYRSMNALETRLANGEKSAVGGRDYAIMRFTQAPLEQLVATDIPAVIYNGSHENGIAFVRRRYGRHEVDSSLLQRCTVVDIMAPYGSFKKSLVFFRDGSSLFLVSHYGSGRQVSNASALMLYEGEKDKQRIPKKNIVLARNKKIIATSVQQLIDKVLSDEAEKIRAEAHPFVTPDQLLDLPTVPMITDQPEQLRQANSRSSENSHWSTHKVDSLNEIHIAYLKDQNGQLIRQVVGPVGHKGLYGDTVYEFILALENSPHINNFVPHIIFTGTAGGFDGCENLDNFKDNGIKGLPISSDEQRIVIPTKGMEDVNGMLPLHTLINTVGETDRLSQLLNQLNLYKTDFHYVLDAPGLETDGLMNQIESKGHATVDIEGIWGVKAALALRQLGYKQATFTPAYHLSDNVKEGVEDVTKSLAFGGFLSNGSNPIPTLYDVLVELSYMGVKASQMS